MYSVYSVMDQLCMRWIFFPAPEVRFYNPFFFYCSCVYFSFCTVLSVIQIKTRTASTWTLNDEGGTSSDSYESDAALQTRFGFS